MSNCDYVIHHQTKNRSFLRMYTVLKHLGVKNNKFFLRLYDKDLAEVDPHDPKLDRATKAKVLRECMRNPWYFAREVVRIPVPGGIKRFELHRGNLAELFCMFMNLNFILVLPRQNYKTISLVCGFAWVYLFGTKNSNILFGNKEKGDACLNIQRLKDIIREVPDYLIFKSKVGEDVDNVESMKYNKRNNKVEIVSTARDAAQADNLGRGMTAPMIWNDEFAFLKYNDIIYTAASPAQSQAMQEAKRNGKPYFKAITTTPNNIDVPAGRYCKTMIDQSAEFTEDMYDWDAKRIEEFIDKNSENDFVFIQFTYKELGRDEAWFRKQKRALNNELLKIKRELLLEWTKATDTSPWSEEQMTEIESHVKPYIGSIYVRKYYPLHLIKPIDPKKVYLVGIDCAGGLDRDYSAIVIIDPDGMEPVGYMANNKVDTDEWFKICYELMDTILPNGVLIPERNSYGLSLVDRFTKTKFEKRMFFHWKMNTSEKKVGSVTKSKTKTKTKVYGIDTSSKSRDLMLDLLKNEVVDNPQTLNFERLFQEIRTLEIKKNGKVEHAEGEHDDVLFAYLVVRYAAAHHMDTLSKFLKAGDAGEARRFGQIAGMNDENSPTAALMRQQVDAQAKMDTPETNPRDTQPVRRRGLRLPSGEVVGPGGGNAMQSIIDLNK